VKSWNQARREATGVKPRGNEDGSDGRGSFTWAHGAFDNNVASLAEIFTRIGVTPVAPIENLRGY